MKPLADAINTLLYWEQPKVSQRNYILRSEENTFGKLHFVSAFNSTADAISDEGRWIIKQIGFFSDRVIVQPIDSDVELACYRPDWTGSSGEIQFPTGEKYTWKGINFFGTKFAITKIDGSELITYVSAARSKKFSNLFKQEARMVITPQACHNIELPILVLLGWYLVIVHQDNTAVIAATASLG